MSARASHPASFTLSVASGDALDVRHFTVKEQLSTLFSVSVNVVTDNADIDFEALIGQPAGFEVSGGVAAERKRAWWGICKEVQEIAAEETGLSTYVVEIVPVLWLATQRRSYRMFQQLSEVEIALQILNEWGIVPVKKLSAIYKKRKYRVQYAESDYAFVCRLLEDAGISFYFAEADGETKLVLSDAPQNNEAREPAIRFRDTPGAVDLEHVTALRIARKVRPGRYSVRDHDSRRAPGFKLLASATQAPGVEKELERYHYAPGAFLYESELGESTPSADDKGRYRSDDVEGAALAKRRLEVKRSEAVTYTFESNVIDLAPGAVIGLSEHPRRDLGDGRYLLITASSMSGTVGKEWSVYCEARRADVPFRPALATPRPRVNGVESATVVGPSGEEIHTDELGRIRVHFHWDRESEMNENSSCWIHVSQPWGGTGYGGVNLPRVGQEVLVDFLGGDPDRPVVVGRVYTNLQKVPYKLPGSKTQSGWKSNSTNGTGGYNELMFEDAAGSELLRMQAERDMQTLVKHDQRETIGHDRMRDVKRDETITIGRNLTKRVVGTEREMTGIHRSITVGVNRTSQIGAKDVAMIGDTFLVMISPPGEGGPSTSSSILMTDKKIVLDTGAGATITMDGDKITIEADDLVEIHGKKRGVNIHASAPGGGAGIFTGKSFTVNTTDVNITGENTILGGTRTTLGGGTVDVIAGGVVNISGGVVQINGPGLPAGRVLDLAPAAITRGSSTVFIGGAATLRDITRGPDGELVYGKGIKIKGDAEYESRALAAICRLDGTPTMHSAFDALEASGHSQTLVPYVPGHDEDAFNATTSAKDGGALTPGVGSDSTIRWDPNVNGFGPPGTTPESEQPGSDIILAHELIHGTHNALGTAGHGPINSDGVDISEERSTVGLPARTYDRPGDPFNGTPLPATTGEPFTENKVRDDYAKAGLLSPITNQPPIQRKSYYRENPDGNPGDPL